MANLKDDLDQYLLLQSGEKKTFNIEVPALEFPNIFKRETSWCPTLTRLQRIVGFVACLGIGTLLITISMFYIPVLLLKTVKFSLLYTMGSLFCILSLCFLTGFLPFLKMLFTKQRALVSSIYFSCLFATLYCALWAHSTALTVVFALSQMIALAFTIIMTIPFGASGIKLFGSLFKSSVSSRFSTTLPV